MKLMIIVLVTTLFLAGLLTPNAFAQEMDPEILNFERYKSIVKNIEIMRRVLIKAVGEHDLFMSPALSQIPTLGYLFAQNKVDALGTEKTAKVVNPLEVNARIVSPENSPFGQSGVSNSKGYYVPGSGAVFSLDVFVKSKSMEADKTKDDPNDLWEEAEKEMSQGHGKEFSKWQGLKQKYIPDPAAVNKMIDLLIETVGTHGKRIKELSDKDKITLIVKFKTTGPDPRNLLKGDLAFLMTTYRVTVDVIIQIPISSITTYQAGKQSTEYQDKRSIDILSELKRESKIIKYSEKKAETKSF